MLANLHLHKDTIASEWLLFKLAEKIGKMRAQDELPAIINKAVELGTSIKETLLADEKLGGVFSETDLAMLDAPENYTGQAGFIVDEVLADVARLRNNDKKTILSTSLRNTIVT